MRNGNPEHGAGGSQGSLGGDEATQLRVVLDARDDNPDGIGRYTRELARALEAVVPARSSLTLLSPGGPPRYTRDEGRRLVELAAGEQADVVHCLDYRVPLAHVPAAVVVSIHDLHRLTATQLCYSDEQFAGRLGAERLAELAETVSVLRAAHDRPAAAPETSLHAQFYELMLRTALQRADVVLVPTRTVRSQLTTACSFRAPVVVAPYGADHLPPVDRRFSPDARLTAALGDRPFFLYVGQDRAHKQVDAVLRGFARVASREPSALLVLVGPSFEPARFVHPIEASRWPARTVLAGAVDDLTLAWLFARCAALVHLASHEGFGFTPLEAMNQGAPVVSADIAGLRETLGVHARFVPPEDAEAVAITLLDVLRSDRDSGRTARIAHARSFSWRKCGHATLAAYRMAVEGRRPRGWGARAGSP